MLHSSELHSPASGSVGRLKQGAVARIASGSGAATARSRGVARARFTMSSARPPQSPRKREAGRRAAKTST
eukprot:scaffold207667_cov29-Tisochrysis_lutea.AAC.1